MAAVVDRARSCAVVRDRERSCAVVRGRARSCAVVRGRAWSCVVVRGRAWSCAAAVRGRARSCVVVRGRHSLPFCPLRGQHCHDARTDGHTDGQHIIPPWGGVGQFFLSYYSVLPRFSKGQGAI